MTRARARCTASLAESKKEHGKAAAEHGLGLFFIRNAYKQSAQEWTHCEERSCFSIWNKKPGQSVRNFVMLNRRRTSFLRLFYCLTHSRPCCNIRGRVCRDPRQKNPTGLIAWSILCSFVSHYWQSVALKRSTQTGRAVVHIRILVLSLVSVFSGFRKFDSPEKNVDCLQHTDKSMSLCIQIKGLCRAFFVLM